MYRPLCICKLCKHEGRRESELLKVQEIPTFVGKTPINLNKKKTVSATVFLPSSPLIATQYLKKQRSIVLFFYYRFRPKLNY